MKKLFTFFAIIALSINCFAQIPNGTFETWNTISFNEPTGWFNSNSDAISQGLPFNVTQNTPAHGGNYALKMETIATTDTMFGFISNSPEPFDGIGGVPYAMLPDSFFCWAKLGIQPLDTALIIIIFKNAGSMVGMDIFKVSENTPTTWQKLGFELSTLGSTPDSVIIAIVSSNAMSGQGIQNGSFMILDELSFNTSQAIADGGFENWGVTTIETPTTWDCKSALDMWRATTVLPLQKTTDKYEGQYALKMTTMAADTNWFFTGINNGYWDNNAMHFLYGFPFANQVDTLIGWYKYTPKTVDSAQVNIEFKAAGSSFGQHQTWLTSNSTWTKFEIPLDLAQMPDTAIITMNSSSWPFTLSDTGSVLIIDALQFLSNPITSVRPFAAGANVLIGPNPTSGELNILYVPINAGKASYSIFDETGKMVKNEVLNDIKTTINISGYPKGVYFVKINDGDRVLSKKLVLQ